jgi:hypothetical protein
VRGPDRCGGHNDDAGRGAFVLVEVVVALVLLAVGVLAMAGLLRITAAEASDADLRERLLWRVTQTADSLLAGEASGAGIRELPGGGRVRWSLGPKAGVVEGILPGADSAWIQLALHRTPPSSILGPEN